MKPLISCIMSNYNTEPEMFKIAIDSILSQTLEDFELILIDDKSTDETSTKIIREYAKKDSRIIAIYNERNKGLAGALNEGLKVARGEYIARFDTDDICVKNRFEKQISYMKKNNLDICSTFSHPFGAYEDVVATWFHTCKLLPVQMLFSCYICHPSVMMKTSFLKKYNLCYDEAFDGAEDFDLFSRCCEKKARICIMPEVLLHYRLHGSSVCHTQKPKQIVLSKKICKRQLDNMQVKYSEDEWNLHLILCGLHPYKQENYKDLKAWCQKLICVNKENACFEPGAFSKVIYNRFLGAVLKAELPLQKKIKIICSDFNLLSYSNIAAIIYKKVFKFMYKLKGQGKNAEK